MASGGRWDSAYEAYQQQSRFSSLDGLRGLSILAVVWHHSVAGDGLLGRGYLGVDLFFAISGFLITTLLLREHAHRGRIDLRAFYVRRALRIFPLYYAVLGVYVLGWLYTLRGTKLGDRFAADLPSFVTFTSNWFVQLEPGVPVAFAHAWSLATEEQFYLVWPFLLFALVRRPRGLLLAMIAVTALATSDVLVTRWTSGDAFLRTAFTSLATPICAGVLVSGLLHSRAGFNRVAPLLAHPIAPIVTSLAVIALVWLRPEPTLLAVCMALLVGGCVIREDHVLRPALTSRPLAYVGRVSYGMYLIHPLVIGLLAVPLTGAVHPFVSTTALTLAIAALSFRYFEAPLIGLKRRRAQPRKGLSVA